MRFTVHRFSLFLYCKTKCWRSLFSFFSFPEQEMRICALYSTCWTEEREKRRRIHWSCLSLSLSLSLPFRMQTLTALLKSRCEEKKEEQRNVRVMIVCAQDERTARKKSNGYRDKCIRSRSSRNTSGWTLLLWAVCLIIIIVALAIWSSRLCILEKTSAR